MILIACRLSNQLDVLLLVFVTIALDAPDNLSTGLISTQTFSLVLTWNAFCREDIERPAFAGNRPVMLGTLVPQR